MKKNSTPFNFSNTQKETKNRPRGPFFLAVFLTLIIIGIVFSVAKKSSVDADIRTHAALSNNLQTYAIKSIKFANDSNQGHAASFEQLRSIDDAISNTLSQLETGNSEGRFPASDGENLIQLRKVINQWKPDRKNIKTILSAEKITRLTKELARNLNAVMPSIITSSEQLINNITQKRPNPNLILAASKQLLLTQSIINSISLLTQQNSNTKTAIQALLNDSRKFHNTLNNMLKGNSKKNIIKIKRRSLRKEVSSLLLTFKTVEELINRISTNAERLHQARLAANSMSHNTNALLDSINALNKSYLNGSSTQQNINGLIYGLEGLALFILVALVFTMNQTRQSPTTSAEEDANINTGSETHQETRDAIAKLQNEIAPIANGDLTISASVNKGITESLSKTMNISIDSLRQLVRNIDIMATQVSETAEESQATAIHLANASDKQARQLSSVTNNINKMVQSFQDVAKQAQASSQLANKAVHMAEEGGQSVRNTLNAMQTLTDDIYHTSSSIKRLGESSQEIGNIVELINDIADQTNILALNAAIKASVAGESGQNFTIVADEVQQLAERVTQATQKIESLVNSIQLDTAQAVTSMEQSNTDVMHGSKLALTAGDELLRIEALSSHLAEFITNVANAMTDLTETSIEISLEMNSIKKVTERHLSSTKKTAALTGKLSELANVQQETVKGFKLPKNGA